MYSEQAQRIEQLGVDSPRFQDQPTALPVACSHHCSRPLTLPFHGRQWPRGFSCQGFNPFSPATLAKVASQAKFGPLCLPVPNLFLFYIH
jgi:hypothetical protein